MLNITKNNIPFVLPSDINIPWVFRSPFFNDYASRTGTFDVSAKSDRNQFLFDYPSHLTKKNRSALSNEIVIKNNTFQKNALLRLQNSNSESLQSIIYFDEGRFYNLVGEMTLKDIDLGSFYIGSSSAEIVEHANSIVDKQYPETNHAFPSLYCPNFYGTDNELNPDFLSISNYYDPDIGYPINEPRTTAMTNYNNNNLVPCPYAFFILEKIFSEFGYTLRGHTFTYDKELLSLIVLSNYSLDLIEANSSCYISQLFKQNFGLDGDIIKFNNDSIYGCYDPLNIHNVSTHLTTIKEQGRYHFELNLKAFHNDLRYRPTIRFVLFLDNLEILEMFEAVDLDQSEQYLDYSFEFEQIFTEFDVNKKIHIKAFFELEATGMKSTGLIKDSTLLIDNLDANLRNRYTDTIYYNNHVPDISIKSFINTIETLTCSVFTFNDSDRSVTINFWDDILSSFNQSDDLGRIVSESFQVDYSSIYTGYRIGYSDSSDIDISNYNRLPNTNVKPTGTGNHKINDVVLCVPLNSFYIFRIPTDSEDNVAIWEFFIKNIGDYEFLEDQTKVLSISIESVIPKIDYINLPYLMPVIEESGYSDSFPNEGSELPLSLVFYRGFIDDEFQPNYPLASPYNILSNGQTFGKYSLNPSDLALTLFKRYISWMLTRYPIELKSYITLSFLQSLCYTDKINLNGTLYLLDSIEVSMELQNLTEATIKLYSA